MFKCDETYGDTTPLQLQTLADAAENEKKAVGQFKSQMSAFNHITPNIHAMKNESNGFVRCIEVLSEKLQGAINEHQKPNALVTRLVNACDTQAARGQTVNTTVENFLREKNLKLFLLQTIHLVNMSTR